jgi:hypothetical protein
MKYNIGDIVQMNSTWEHKCGIILNTDDDRKEYPSVYQVLIQGINNPTWLPENYILRRIYAKI